MLNYIKKKNGLRNLKRKTAVLKELNEKGYKLKYLLKVIAIPRSTYYSEKDKI